MKTQSKVKFIISIAIILVIALLCLTGFQIFKINQAKKQISNQQQEIIRLQQQIDNYEKTPNSDHETITGENE